MEEPKEVVLCKCVEAGLQNELHKIYKAKKIQQSHRSKVAWFDFAKNSF